MQPVPPANDQRPPLEPNVPCETQPKIATLDTPEGAGPTQVHPAVASAAEQALQNSTTKLLGSELGQIIKATGSPFKVAGVSASSTSSSTSKAKQ